MITPEPNATVTSTLPPVRQRSFSSALGGSCSNTNSINHASFRNVTPVDLSTAPSNLSFRNVTPMDLPDVYKLEKASYPPDEAASRTKLQYRQHHAAPYFRCAILAPLDAPENVISDAVYTSTPATTHNCSDNSNTISGSVDAIPQETILTIETSPVSSTTVSITCPTMIGYITATRCHTFSKESMSVHSSTGPLLAIHSIVIAEPFRRKGYATAMIDNYIKTVQNMDLKYGIQKIVLIAKANLLSFYVKNGFKVIKPSDIVHGGEPWYECELELGLGGGDMDRGCQYWVVDSFSKYPNHGNSSSTWRGSGNPAAVVMVNPSQSTILPSTSSIISDESIAESDSFSPNLLFDPDKEENIAWMKAVAKEFNLSETAFIWEYVPTTIASSNVESGENSKTTSFNLDGSTPYEIRFYTRNGSPVELCGHATLAASSVVFQIMGTFGKKRDEMITSFRTKNGTVLKARPSTSSGNVSTPSIKGISYGTKVSMEFPWKGLKEWDTLDEKNAAIQVIRDAFFPNKNVSELEPDHIIFIGLEDNREDLLVELKYESFMSLPQKVQEINIECLIAWDGYKRGVIVCCQAPPPVEDESIPIPGTGPVFTPNFPIDFLSRFFAPKIGILEDSVTGSAHCLMGPYYGTKLDKRAVTGMQMSERGGIVECLLKRSGDGGYTVKKTVVVSGIATTTMSGTLYL